MLGELLRRTVADHRGGFEVGIGKIDLGGNQAAAILHGLHLHRQAVKQCVGIELRPAQAEKALLRADFGRITDRDDAALPVGRGNLHVLATARRNHAFDFRAFGQARQVARQRTFDEDGFLRIDIGGLEFLCGQPGRNGERGAHHQSGPDAGGFREFHVQSPWYFQHGSCRLHTLWMQESRRYATRIESVLVPFGLRLDSAGKARACVGRERSCRRRLSVK